MNYELPPHYTSLARALADSFGSETRIASTDRLSGGDINRAYGITLTDGTKIFMKANEKKNASFFTAEAAGLSAIASCGAVKVPKIICTGTDDGEDVGYSFLLLEFVESAGAAGNAGRDGAYWENFARNLAALHSAETKSFTDGGEYGFFQDNFIGFREQKNDCRSTWTDFFRDMRLLPQFSAADSYFTADDRALNEKLLSRLGDFFTGNETPSLVHGDLWGGNVLAGSDGNAWLIDPAAYVGCRECDIAMTELFGGFPKEFYDAYNEVSPLEKGYEERRDLYNLYQLLNHLNMFGGAYLEPVRSIVREFVG